jgi:hypothetical protein
MAGGAEGIRTPDPLHAIDAQVVPAAMLGIVGIQSNPQVTFLVRTLAVALLALSPGAWAARRPG